MGHKNKADHLDRQIEENLRRVYNDKANDPVPDRFTKLLAQLRESEQAEASNPRKDES